MDMVPTWIRIVISMMIFIVVVALAFQAVFSLDAFTEAPSTLQTLIAVIPFLLAVFSFMGSIALLKGHV